MKSMPRLILFFLVLPFLAFECLLAQTPRYVWSNAEGSGRQQKVLFRNSFEVGSIPDTANFYLFASSRYHLYVNGTHINFGPSRFYPANPRYDKYDLSPFLTKGINVIALEVLANGMETFQIFESIGSMISWGSIDAGKGKTISLDSPGKWKMLPVSSLDTLAQKFSFACGAMELYDAQKEPFQWEYQSFDDTNWKSPVLIRNPAYWGVVQPRQIPELTQLESESFQCLGIYDVIKREEFYSFYRKIPDESQALYNRGEQLAGYTWIFSPKDQTLETGTWWGDYYLNGNGPIKVNSKDAKNPVRENRLLALKKGWNFLFVNYRAIWGAWEFTLALPEGSGLELSPQKRHNSPIFFVSSNPLAPEDVRKLLEMVTSGSTNPEKACPHISWFAHNNEIPFKNPVRELVWNQPDASLNLKSNDYQTGNFSFSQTRFFSYDMGKKMLGRVFLDIDAPAGTNIDIGFSEDLNQQGLPYLYKRAQINSGARFVCDGKRTRYETFKPYGIRYLLVKITPSEEATVTLKKIGVIEQMYPFAKTGSFECSDPMFNKIWEMGWRTLRVCSEDSYTDTPFRERGLYAGDALPEYAITLATSGDSRLMKQSLLLFQDMYREEMETGGENRHNDFILKTLVELYWYYQQTGDSTFAKGLFPNYAGYLNHLEKNITTEGYYKAGQVFLEWTKIRKNADLTAYQALLYGSMRMMASMAGDFGYSREQEIFNDRAEALQEAIHRNFWDAEKGSFFDGFDNGSKINNHYPISNFYPLLFNVVDNRNQKEGVIRFLDEELKDIGEETRNRKVTPYGAFYLFSALYENEEAGIAERFLKQYWTRMILQGDDTSWENFDINSEGSGGQGTASHAWSGHPTFFLSTEVLGVKLGFNKPFSRDTIFIMPQSETILWAKGSVPHPAGLVGVDWQISGDKLFINLRLPSGVPFEVLPKGKLSRYKLITTVTRY